MNLSDIDREVIRELNSQLLEQIAENRRLWDMVAELKRQIAMADFRQRELDEVAILSTVSALGRKGAV